MSRELEFGLMDDSAHVRTCSVLCFDESNDNNRKLLHNQVATFRPNLYNVEKREDQAITYTVWVSWQLSSFSGVDVNKLKETLYYVDPSTEVIPKKLNPSGRVISLCKP